MAAERCVAAVAIVGVQPGGNGLAVFGVAAVEPAWDPLGSTTRTTARSSFSRLARRRRSPTRTRLCAPSHPKSGYRSLLLALGTRGQQVTHLVREMVIDALAAAEGDDLSWPATD